MDLDISDILADVSYYNSLHPTSRSTTLGTDPNGALLDHQLLVRHWTSERCTSELLPYPTDSMLRVMTRIREQIDRIEDLTADPTSYTSRPNATTNRTSSQNLNLVLSVLQTDLSRTQFLVRSLLRCRLQKLTKYPMFYLTSLSQDTKANLLSHSEIKFLQSHQTLLSNLYASSFMDTLPPGLRRLDDGAGGDKMVEGSDMYSAVIVRCLVEYWENGDELVDGESTHRESEGATVELRLRLNEIWVVRWKDVKSGVIAGVLELL